MCGVGLGAMIVQHQWSPVARYGAIFLLVSWACWMLFWAPAVRIMSDAVELGNIIRATRIPWTAITDVQPGFSLIVRTANHNYRAWAAPSGTQAGASTRLLEDEEFRLRLPLPDNDTSFMRQIINPDERTLSPSSQASILIRRKWQAAPPRAAGADAANVVVRWHYRRLIILGALAVVVVVCLVL